jgi:hypothetical protein
METLAFFAFLAATILLFFGGFAFLAVLASSLVQRDWAKILTLCAVGGACFVASLLLNLVVVRGELSAWRFSGLGALVCFLYLAIVLSGVLIVWKLSRVQPNTAPQPDAREAPHADQSTQPRAAGRER